MTRKPSLDFQDCVHAEDGLSKYFAASSNPIHLTKGDVQFKWESLQAEAFKEHQRHLQSPTILGHSYTDAETEIYTDASSMGLGSILVQKNDGLENEIAYASRSLSKDDANYSTTGNECLAVIWATSKFQPYLYE